ncbi:MAG: carbohydrate ABC transporter permease [Treponemataceae bacterium]
MRKTRDEILFNGIAFPFLAVLSLVCFLPFLLIITASLTNNNEVVREGFKLIPKSFSLDAYRYIFFVPGKLLRAYGSTLFVTAFGTVGGLVLISMAGYVLHRKDFRYRNKISFFIYFTTLFSGGIIPYYILMTSILGLRNSLFAVILAGLVTPFQIILMRNFMKNVPYELIEAAKIDGANDFRTFTDVVLHLQKPALATIGLFLALGYWNNWYSPMLFLNKAELYPLQYYLYTLLTSEQAIQEAGVAVEGLIFPGETLKMAMAVVATGPVLLVYPYVQKYFVRGITIGAVKG